MTCAIIKISPPPFSRGRVGRGCFVDSPSPYPLPKSGRGDIFLSGFLEGGELGSGGFKTPKKNKRAA